MCKVQRYSSIPPGGHNVGRTVGHCKQHDKQFAELPTSEFLPFIKELISTTCAQPLRQTYETCKEHQSVKSNSNKDGENVKFKIRENVRSVLNSSAFVLRWYPQSRRIYDYRFTSCAYHLATIQGSYAI